jgi:Flp pilus assembly protein TadB
MRGIFWWNRKMDRSWETMEKDTSPFTGRKKRLPKSRKPEKEYPKLHRTHVPRDERFDAPSTEVVGTIIVCICTGLIAALVVMIAMISLLVAAIMAIPGILIAVWLGIRWKRRHRTTWKKKDPNPRE